MSLVPAMSLIAALRGRRRLLTCTTIRFGRPGATRGPLPNAASVWRATASGARMPGC